MLHKAALKRLSRLTRVLVEEELGYLVDHLGLRAHLPFTHRLKKTQFARVASNPERIRSVFERLGASYVKLGQLLSIRPDLVPRAYSEEFRRLQDQVPPMPFKTVMAVVEEELHQKPSSVFQYIEKAPLGSASVAQVHRAVLKHEKKAVVIKVERPDVAQEFEADMEIMYLIAHRLEKSFRLQQFSPVGIVKEFERYTKQELDFLREADFIEKFERQFEGNEHIKIPHCYTEHSTHRLLTLEEIKGVKLSALLSAGNVATPHLINKAIMELAMRQFFHMDIFHADIHPGNIIVMRDGRVGLLDYGIAGSMLPHVREQAVKIYLSLIDKDLKAAEEALLELGEIPERMDTKRFRSDIREVVEEWHSGSTKGQRVTHQMHKLFDVCMKYGITLPTDLTMLGKALVTVEATCLQVDPTFDFVDSSKPYLAGVLESELRGTANVRSLLKKSISLKQFIEQFPRQILSTLQTLERADFKIDIADEDIKDIGRRVYLSADRLSLAMLSGAFVIAGGLIMQVGLAPTWNNYSVLGLIAFILAFLLAIFLVADFWHQRR